MEEGSGQGRRQTSSKWEEDYWSRALNVNRSRYEDVIERVAWSNLKAEKKNVTQNIFYSDQQFASPPPPHFSALKRLLCLYHSSRYSLQCRFLPLSSKTVTTAGKGCAPRIFPPCLPPLHFLSHSIKGTYNVYLYLFACVCVSQLGVGPISLNGRMRLETIKPAWKKEQRGQALLL